MGFAIASVLILSAVLIVRSAQAQAVLRLYGDVPLQEPASGDSQRPGPVHRKPDATGPTLAIDNDMDARYLGSLNF